MPVLVLFLFFFLMIRRPPRSTLDRSSAASDVYKRQPPLPSSPALECYRLDSSPLGLPTLWVDLWWRGEEPADDRQLVFTLTGPDGAEHYRRAHPLLRDGAFDWNPDACLLYTSPSPRDRTRSRMPSSACQQNKSTTTKHVHMYTI